MMQFQYLIKVKIMVAIKIIVTKRSSNYKLLYTIVKQWQHNHVDIGSG